MASAGFQPQNRLCYTGLGDSKYQRKQDQGNQSQFLYLDLDFKIFLFLCHFNFGEISVLVTFQLGDHSVLVTSQKTLMTREIFLVY